MRLLSIGKRAERGSRVRMVKKRMTGREWMDEWKRK